MEGKEKLAIDLPIKTKRDLADLAHKNRLSLTQMVIKLIDDARKK